MVVSGLCWVGGGGNDGGGGLREVEGWRGR